MKSENWNFIIIGFILPLVAGIVLAADSGKAILRPTPTPLPRVQDFHPVHTPTPGHVRLAFVGDINLSRRVGRLLQKKGPQWPFQACKPILDQADLVVANLESPVGKGGEKYTKKSVYLRGKTKDLDALAYGGIGLVTLANNHILDYGPKVMKQTVKGLEERGILYTGLAPEGGVAQEPIFVQVQGVTLAFLGFCSVCPGKFDPGPDRPGVEVAMSKVMLPEIKKAKAKADYVIVLIHWGTEYYGTNALQKRLARSLQKGGADLVIGSHTHVLQQVEVIDKTLVAYSLGNFLFDMKHKACLDSCILMVDLEKGKDIQWKAVPVDLTSGRPEPLAETSEEAQTIQKILKEGYEYDGKKDEKVSTKILNSKF